MSLNEFFVPAVLRSHVAHLHFSVSEARTYMKWFGGPASLENEWPQCPVGHYAARMEEISFVMALEEHEQRADGRRPARCSRAVWLASVYCAWKCVQHPHMMMLALLQCWYSWEERHPHTKTLAFSYHPYGPDALCERAMPYSGAADTVERGGADQVVAGHRALAGKRKNMRWQWRSAATRPHLRLPVYPFTAAPTSVP
jgi:hypothetical protein